MSDGNGTAPVTTTQRRLDAMLTERPRPLKAAELSSQERNALVDSLVEAVNNHAKVLAEHRRWAESQSHTLAEFQSIQDSHAKELKARYASERNHDARIDALTVSHLGRTFWQRLRWFVKGR